MNRFPSLFKNALLAMKWFGLATLFGCTTGKNTVKEGSLISGPFEICWEVTESRSGAWFNNGSNPNAKVYTSWFRVKYKGTIVQIPAYDKYRDTPIEGTSREKPQEYFWQALFLKDAPRPAVLVGMHSMHLLTEENGQLKIAALHEQDGDFAGYQWLDSNKGQPGEPHAVYLGDDSDSSRFLSGGHYLLVNSRVVLDVQTLEVHPFDLITYEVLQRLAQYHAGNSAIVQFSPHQTQMVFVGSRFNPANRLLYQYGLVVIDFKKNTAYAVPFDRTDTRFFSIWDATQSWLNTYFEWTTDASGEDRIVQRKLAQPPNWQGRWIFDDVSNEIQEYKLMPVQDSMLPVLLDFIKKEIVITAETSSKTEHYAVGSTEGTPPACYLTTTTLTTENGTIYVYLNPIEQTLTLYGDRTGVKKIGTDFNQAMQEGKFQAYFGRYE